MSERQISIADMQCWIFRMAQTKWKMSPKECAELFKKYDILGFIDHNITVNVIQNGKITSKKELHLPSQVVNVIRCKNPRCITSIEQELDQVFILTDPGKEVYRCKYCEEKYRGHRNK